MCGSVISSVKPALGAPAATAVADFHLVDVEVASSPQASPGLGANRFPDADVPQALLRVLVDVLVPVDSVPGVGQAPMAASSATPSTAAVVDLSLRVCG